jgi:hypothetical protein
MANDAAIVLRGVDTMSIIHVGHIRSNLNSRFATLVDTSDVASALGSERDSFVLTRSLAAFALAQVASIDDAVAADAVVDGAQDNGLDAIYYDPTEKVCYLVQAKWIHSGNGSIDVGEVQKFVQGCKDLLEPRFERFNDKMRRKQDMIMAALEDSSARFVLIIAYTGQQQLSTEARRPIGDLLEELNDPSALVSLHVLSQSELHAAIARQALGESLTMEVMLNDYGQIREPYGAYYGQVDVSDVATWEQYGQGLTSRNLRRFKGSTDVNDGIENTLRTSPEKFWYFNNGITILCERISKKPIGGTRRTSGVFVCEGASVVNGAQTVGSIAAAATVTPDQLQHARVLVRLISLENCPEGFASELTRAANTQNRIEKKDFAALDPQQERLKTELWLGQQKEYSYKTGDAEPTPERGCTLDEATVALACSHTDIGLAMQAKREVSKLYEDIQKPPYVYLFNPSLTAVRLWRCVEILRAVDASLKEEQRSREGREKLIAVHGNRFVLHAVFRKLQPTDLDDPGADFDQVRQQVPVLAAEVLDRTITEAMRVYPNAYPSNLFKNVSKCRELVQYVLTPATAPLGRG